MIALYIGIWEKNLAIMVFLVIFIKRMKKDGNGSAIGVSEQQIEGAPKDLDTHFWSSIPVTEIRAALPKWRSQMHLWFRRFVWMLSGKQLAIIEQNCWFSLYHFSFCFGCLRMVKSNSSKKGNSSYVVERTWRWKEKKQKKRWGRKKKKAQLVSFICCSFSSWVI